VTTTPTGVERILLVRVGKIGDLIVANFVFRKVRSVFPRAMIKLVTLERNQELLQYNQTIDSVRYFRRGIDLLPLLLWTRAFRPDLFLDFNDNPSSTSALLARFSPARVRVGFAFPGNIRHLTHPVECPAKEETHITERLRRIPEAVGISFSPEEVVPSMDLGNAEAREVRARLESEARGARRVVAVNLSAGDPSRYWQRERWRELLAGIAARGSSGLFVLLTAPGDESSAAEVSGSLPALRTFSPGRIPFHQFAAYIAQADLLISADTSAVHIASAFRTPVLALYPAVAWNFRSWSPLATDFEAVRPLEGDVTNIPVPEVLEAYVRLHSRLPG
jgi:ADP-heptose:LPS heptosyltransferase